MNERFTAFLKTATGSILAALSIVLIVSVLSYSAVMQIAGLAVAQTSTKWNNLKDAAAGDNQTSGVMLNTPCLWNTGLTSCSRQQGANGAAFVSLATSGSAFFAVKRDNITTSSANLAFGFTSRKVALEFPLTNTDEVCIDWLGGTAVCPAANTAGDDRFAPGDVILLDDFAQTSISLIANSGTQMVYVRAWQ